MDRSEMEQALWFKGLTTGEAKLMVGLALESGPNGDKARSEIDKLIGLHPNLEALKADYLAKEISTKIRGAIAGLEWGKLGDPRERARAIGATLRRVVTEDYKGVVRGMVWQKDRILTTAEIMAASILITTDRNGNLVSVKLATDSEAATA